jgi:signal transduction histidine kinase
MVILTVVIGVIVWIVLDNIQSRRIKNIFMAQLTERLGQQAMEDRLRFDRYVKAHQQSVRIFVMQNNFIDYIDKQRWSSRDTVKYYNNAPPWFPGRTMLRTLPQPRYALLLDSGGKVREAYQRGKDTLPQFLLQPASLLIDKSNEQSYMTTFDNAPYLITSASYLNSQERLMATLMLATPIDDEFLNDAIGISTQRDIVALITPGENPRVLISSNLMEIPSGMPLDALQKEYLVTGKEFFDYGSSDLVIKFISLISLAKADELTRSLILRERWERAVSAFVLILSVAVVMFYITQRIQRLTGRISHFSQHTLGIQQREIQKGDQLHVLEERFQHLTEEVVRSREIIKEQAEKQAREEEAKTIQAKLIHANKMTSLGTLVSGVAHEINNPNSFIMSNAQLFNDIWKDIFLVLNEHYKKNGDFPIGDMKFSEIQSLVPRLLNTITKGTERIKNIVDSLKNFARADTGNLDEKVDVNKVVENAIFFLNAEIKRFTNNFHVTCKDNIPFVKGSSRQLEQVVINLLMNSLQALDNRERGIWITTSHDEKADSVLIRVKDEGCGIQKDMLDRITEPFFTTKLNQGGTGLGLSISYAIVKEHKGSMEFISEPGKGATACITLPVYDKLRFKEQLIEQQWSSDTPRR